jgi:hypothetical protein
MKRDMNMNHTTVLYVIGLAALALGGAAHLKAPVNKTIIQPVQQATASGKVNPYAWGELQQAEVDALQKILEAMPKQPVTIFCSDDNCRDIVLDFDNAFESAKWQTDIQRPMIDNSIGLWTSSRDLADAITKATGGRLNLSVMGPEWSDKERIALAVGRKPAKPRACNSVTQSDVLNCGFSLGDQK